jgi:uncharacterized protein
MPGWYELNKSKNGQFNFVLKAANGEVILRSEQYQTKRSALNGIASIQTNSLLDERFEKKEAKGDKSFFNLKAGNHQVIGTSQMYETTKSRDGGMKSVMVNGKTATIKDNT